MNGYLTVSFFCFGVLDTLSQHQLSLVQDASKCHGVVEGLIRVGQRKPRKPRKLWRMPKRLQKVRSFRPGNICKGF